MKILFINLPYYGHVVPTLGLVQELKRLGNQVTYLMPYDWQEKVAVCGADFAGYENHKKLSEQIKNAFHAADKVIQDFDLVIYEQFFFVGKHLAEKYGKPVVRIFTAPVTNERLMEEYVQAGGALGIFCHKWVGRAWTRDVVKATGVSLKTDCWLEEIVQNPPELNLVYTLEEYQPYIEAFPKEQYRFLGASIYERDEGEFTLPEPKKPLIYISLGTVVRGVVSFFKKCIEAFEGANVQVIMSVGNSCEVERLGHLPDNFQVYPTVPQVSVLKRASVFVTHGGMNSVSEALVCGVPMVVIPFMADQPTNARRIEELGLGRQLDYKRLDSVVLRETVLTVLGSEKITEQVASMQAKLQNCPGNAGGAEMIVDYYNRYKL